MSSANNIPWPPNFPADGPPTDWSAFWKWLRRVWNAVRSGNNFQGASSDMRSTDPSKFPGSTYFQTDRTVTYLSVNSAWVYTSGEMRSTSQTLADLPGDLGENDAGLRYRNSYFERVWEWDGGSWHYADAGLPAGAQMATSGPAPSGGLWQKCDGTSVACALDNATIKQLQTSNTQAVGQNNPVIEGGAGGAQQEAKAGTFQTPVGVATLNNTTGITIGSDTDAGGKAASGSTSSLFALNPHTHNPTDPGHNHPVSVTQPVLSAPSENNGGLPLRVSMAWWMRR